MSDVNKVKVVKMNINDIITKVKLDAVVRLEREIAQIENTQLARCILSEFPWLDVPPARRYSANYLHLTIEASEGMSPATAKRDVQQKIIKICRALGCPLKASGKTVDEDRPKEIKVSLIPRDYPNVILYYYAPLPRGKKAKCRVVTVKPRPYKTLVCES